MGRFQPLDPAAFLVDQHRGIRASARGLEIGHQPGDLIGVDAIALEQDKAGRIGRAEAIALGLAQPRTRAAEDDRPGRRVTV